MACSTIEIGSPSRALPQCSPHLMPFHINYSGPAPIATYFRVKPTTLLSEAANLIDVEAPTFVGEASQNTVADSDANDSQLQSQSQSQQESDPQPEATGATGAMDTTGDLETRPPTTAALLSPPSPVIPSIPTPNPTKQKPASLGARFKAAFRGRTVHGVTVNLPDGYAGIVFRAPGGSGSDKGTGKGKRQAEKTAAGRPKRGKAGKGKAAEVDVDMEVDDDEAAQEQESVRTLMPTATFASFVLWAPDAPPDEARDEYLRALTEWTALAEEIHRVED
ncbi:hypothetical protein FIBSPDRAFT_947475 [Athelia psychrophila]|uniref:Uncharacterized protein n=1 Tax=Athelia psychrophila TaxID=1759441 RepID=A0A166RU13_9AGAM|nr:hypothetical protein FIBSPDRAFT_947475 [Fibularhizoctonia sp. CBS 109695]